MSLAEYRRKCDFAKAPEPARQDRRRGVYVDVLPNVRDRTTAGPYRVRPLRASLTTVADLLAPALALAQRLPAGYPGAVAR